VLGAFERDRGREGEREVEGFLPPMVGRGKKQGEDQRGGVHRAIIMER
jgi:hypothetical protein